MKVRNGFAVGLVATLSAAVVHAEEPAKADAIEEIVVTAPYPAHLLKEQIAVAAPKPENVIMQSEEAPKISSDEFAFEPEITISL